MADGQIVLMMQIMIAVMLAVYDMMIELSAALDAMQMVTQETTVTLMLMLLTATRLIVVAWLAADTTAITLKVRVFPALSTFLQTNRRARNER
eukprot:121679-Pleurochrysis_carterae.AAC.3